ncbi:STN domain-containing protein [Taibaiella soli]|uniref:Secretin/TonB short N-terminal domain-containing protein n=1 Tax=Taibaiella soli TaxID=1649169 RepID=A0A2W2AEW7_9BACT|nr:STN domain-containing protein [Taibaiella soli]PZF74025.1 hypothetical protein DN068_04835 [Taibaiella soli]
MTFRPRRAKEIIFTIFILLIAAFPAWAQNLLDKPVSLNASNQPLRSVLNDISKQGGFYFSYNSKLVNGDQLVTISVQQVPVKQVLDQLLQGNCQYREDGNHIILQPQGKEKVYTLSGYIVDGATGTRIGNTSVYEKQQLASSLTNEQGYFKMRLKSKYPEAVVSISKEWYKDTSITITPGMDQELQITMMPIRNVPLPEVTVSANDQQKPNDVDETWFGKLFLSSRQKVQSVNLRKYFVDKPYQFSAIPGAGTHGRMSGQVVNKFSFNLIGGYTAGVNGFELAGLFNIDKKDVQYAQVAGVFNAVGGNMRGGQVAGILNLVLDSVEGASVAGAGGFIKGDLKGTQVSGLYNQTSGNVEGVQVAGAFNVALGNVKGVQASVIGNYTNKNVEGTQVSAYINVCRREVEGVQASVFVNVARKVKGVQVALINVADSSEGYSIGFLNLVKNGYHKLCVYNNEVLPINFALKTGNTHFYTILTGGLSPDAANKGYLMGYGFGSEMKITKRLTIAAELTTQYLFLGDWEQRSLLNRIQPVFNYKISKLITVFGGPAYSVYYHSPVVGTERYMNEVPSALYQTHSFSEHVNGWFGWNIGISFF